MRIRYPMNEFKIVARNKQSARRCLLHSNQCIDQVLSRFFIELVGRLIQDQNRIAAAKRSQHFDHFLLSGRHLFDPLVQKRIEMQNFCVLFQIGKYRFSVNPLQDTITDNIINACKLVG